ncbi:arsenate reductase [Polaribacter sp. Z014]|uniref:arsenate reductase family protein n=1 Tax=Polaribacter sp. Z014 TaxID=2927126 RepID=UPI002021A1AC|nr:ArsC/Spx/MgsR family protein [Polaribacter sp. Z014]MCL7761797.1 arsenate reductase [Polaribacter sp. Z014]
MKKVYFLQTCDTCRRILKEVNTDGFERQEIKTNNITAAQLEEMYALSGSYEALFNKRAKLYKSMDLKNQTLSEADYRQFLLDEYTFLKRPVFIVDEEIFIGNSKKVIEALKEKIG